MTEMRVSAVVDLEGNLSRRAQQYSRDLSRFSSSGTRSMGMLRRGMSATGRTMEGMGNRYTALITGAAGLGAAKGVMALDKRMTQLGVNTEMTDEQVNKLKKTVFDVSQQPELRLDPAGLLDAIDQIVAKTGEVDVAVENLENIGRVIGATGAAGNDVGDMIANMFEKFGIDKAEDMLKTLDTLVLQGKAGAFEMRDLATQGNEVMAAYATTGRTGDGAIREMGAMLQMIRRTSGSTAEAGTNFERLISSITIEKTSDLQKRGIKIWDEEKLAEGIKVARSIPDIVKDIVRGTEGDMEKLGEVFDIRALRALNAFTLEYKETGSFASLDKFLAMQGDGNKLIDDSARNAKTPAAVMTYLLSLGKEWQDMKLDGPLQDLADAIGSMDEEKIKRIMDVLAAGAVGIAGYAVGAKALRGIGSIVGSGKGKTGALGGIAGAAGVTPVFVTNFPGVPGGLGKTAGAAGAGAAVASKGRVAAAAARFSAPGLAVAGAGLTGAAVGGQVYKHIIDGTAFNDKLGKMLMDVGAALGVDSAVELKKFLRDQKFKANLAIKIATDEGNTVRVQEIKDHYNSMDIDVDTGASGYRPRSRSAR